MSKKEFEPDDPMELHGVEVPASSEAELRDMILCFAEEFVREGWTRERLLKVFRDPAYKGPYLAWLQKGDEYVADIIEQAFKMWRPVRWDLRERDMSSDATGGRV
ncbi:MAG: hypothetical protein MOGMAGMI_02129 [Candidatus Omnitrophica bacterium]|nr:hypothetical protein [Candidatus Omnitrophota bacterium]